MFQDDNDDNDFLGDVVQFGDGTQYSVPPTATSEFPPDVVTTEDGPAGTAREKQPDGGPLDDVPPRGDRFQDDFDRSWPRGPPPIATNSPKPSAREVSSPAASHASTLHSERDRDRDRALFNEKSNRLEPYNTSDRGSFFQNRDGDSNRGSGFRPTRDQPQPQPSNNDRERDAPNGFGLRTPSFGGRGFGRPPWAGRVPSGQFRGETPMGPPGMQPPSHGSLWNKGENRRFSTSSREDGYSQDVSSSGRPVRASGAWNRQPLDSPHPSHGRPDPGHRPPSYPNNATFRPTVPDRRPSVSSVFSPNQPTSGVSPPSEPAPGDVPPTTNTASVPQLGLEEVTKLAMHSAAERAKIRRQEEEAAREQQRERARAKAAAIEASQLAQEAEKLQRVLAVQEAERKEREMAEAGAADRKRKEEEVMKKLQEEERAMRHRERQAAEAREQERERLKRAVVEPPEMKPPPATRPKLQLLPRTIPVPSIVPVPGPKERQKVPVKLNPTSNSSDIVPVPIPGSIPVASHDHEVLNSLDIQPGADIQTVDFLDMASLMGVVEELQIDTSKSQTVEKRQRPVASDFFDSNQPLDSSTRAGPVGGNVGGGDASSWRSESQFSAPVGHQTSYDKPEAPFLDQVPSTPSQKPLNFTVTSPTLSASSRVTTSPSAQRSVYKQAPLSSLADTISRFKGVLATMHTVPEGSEAFEPPLRSHSGAPIPLRFAMTRDMDFEIDALQAIEEEPVFLLAKRINYALASEAQERFANWRPKRKLQRLKIMSYEPSIVNISPRTLSRDDVLLSAQNVYKVIFNPPKVPVGRPSGPVSERGHSVPKRAGFGRGSGAEESDWRRRLISESGPSNSQTPQNLAQSAAPTGNLATSLLGPTVALVDDLAPIPRDNEPPSPSRKGKSKLDPRSDVGFYRPSQVPDIPTVLPVSFMVRSEIEGSSPRAFPEEETFSHPNGLEPTAEETVSASVRFPASYLIHSKPSSQSEATLLTPPVAHSATSWTRSPAIYPLKSARSDTDPDHIKAVWEHGPPDSSTNANSLKDVTDEYPAAILLSMQEIKLDDGEPKSEGGTPPASSSTAPIHRKSLQDAHRAFQVVPPAPPPQQSFDGYHGLPGAHTGEFYPSPTVDLYGQQGYSSGLPYGSRPFQTPPAPNMMWASQSPYAAPLNLAPHGMGPPMTPGHQPPVPHGWPQQQPPSPYPQYNGNPATYSYMAPPPTMNPGGFKIPAGTSPSFNGPPNGSPAMQSGARRYPPVHHLQHPSQAPHYGASIPVGGPQVMSPNLYGTTLPSTGQGYGPLSPAGRGGSRTPFELPPPATTQLYPQMGNSFHPQRR